MEYEGMKRPGIGAMSWQEIRDEYGIGWDSIHKRFYRSGPGRGSAAAVADGLISPEGVSPGMWGDIEYNPVTGAPKRDYPIEYRGTWAPALDLEAIRADLGQVYGRPVADGVSDDTGAVQGVFDRRIPLLTSHEWRESGGVNSVTNIDPALDGLGQWEAPGIRLHDYAGPVQYAYNQEEQRLRVWSDAGGESIELAGGEAYTVYATIVRISTGSPLPSLIQFYLMGLLEGASLTTKTAVNVCGKAL